MATSSTRAQRSVHVHGAEVSTDGDSVGAYAEAIALVIAIVAVLAAVWIASVPSEGADLIAPNTSQPASGEYVLAPEGTAIQPDPDGVGEVAVIVPGGTPTTGPVTFGDPFGTGLGVAPAS